MGVKSLKGKNMTEKVTVEYVNNADFYEALRLYKLECDQNPDEQPQVPEYIGACFLKIATNLARRPNFGGYSYRNDMIGDAIETCLKRVKSFDPEKSKSAFSYFTQVCWYAMVDRIKTEQAQARVKRAIVYNACVDTSTLQEHDETGEFTIQLNEFLMSLGPEDVPNKPKQVLPDPLSEFYE